MITELNDVIDAEILFEQQEVVDNSADSFEKLLLKIVALLEAGKTLKQIKKIIEDSDVNKDLRENLDNMIGEQLENITDKKQSFDFNKATIAGLTFNELLQERKDNTKKQARRFMAKMQDIIKAGGAGIAQAVNDELNRYKGGIETFYRTQTKGAREFGYAKNDKVNSKEVKGWISISVLDNKTSAICLSLHNKFYAKGDTYQTRFDLPYQIPRHPRCRSIFITVFKGKSIQSYKGANLEKFLMNNESTGKELLGIKKYDLFVNKKIKLVNFVDLKGKRFYTNEQIKKRLNIKG